MRISEAELREQLLAWYDVNARDLPWRVLPSARIHGGAAADPYKVWLSEIMLQQTTIATVKPYFARFLHAFPTIEALASAPIEAVLANWAGLGYYARGRNLHACAQAIVRRGGFPQTREGLSQLPGVGPYTAAAVAAIAFDQPCVPVDGNVERVLSRLMRIEAPLPAAKPIFRDAAARFEDTHRPSDFAQALMDLGSTVCTPKKPNCRACPWRNACLSVGTDDLESFPRKTPKKAKAVRFGVAFVHVNARGVLVATRPSMGLLGGMLEVPNTAWRDMPWSFEEAQAFAPLQGQVWRKARGVRHIFTHIDLTLDVYVAGSLDAAAANDNAHRILVADLGSAALPSLFSKVIAAGLAQQMPIY